MRTKIKRQKNIKSNIGMIWIYCSNRCVWRQWKKPKQIKTTGIISQISNYFYQSTYPKWIYFGSAMKMILCMYMYILCMYRVQHVNSFRNSVGSINLLSINSRYYHEKISTYQTIRGNPRQNSNDKYLLEVLRHFQFLCSNGFTEEPIDKNTVIHTRGFTVSVLLHSQFSSASSSIVPRAKCIVHYLNSNDNSTTYGLNIRDPLFQ